MQRQHKAQPPPLRLLRRLRIQFRDRVREVGFRGGDTLAAEIRELRDLVGEDLGDGLGGEEAVVGGGGGAVVEEGGEDC